MSYTLEAFGSYTLPADKTVTDVGTGASRTNLLALPGGGFYDPLGASQAPRNENRPTKDCAIVAATPEAVDAAYDEVRVLRGTRNKLYRRRADGALEWCYARLDSIVATREARHINYLELSLNFLMISPCWYGETEEDHLHTDIGEEDGSLALVGVQGGTTGMPVVITVNNRGNQDQPDILFKITSGTGSITNIIINNTTSGHILTYTGTVLTGENVTIDCGAYSVTNSGYILPLPPEDYAHLTPPADKEEWMVLKPGPNNISLTITDSGIGTSAEVTYYDPFA